MSPLSRVPTASLRRPRIQTDDEDDVPGDTDHEVDASPLDQGASDSRWPTHPSPTAENAVNTTIIATATTVKTRTIRGSRQPSQIGATMAYELRTTTA